MSELNLADVHIRVIDQRIGAGIGGLNTVIRLYHVPTGVLIELPRGNRQQYYDREIGMKMLELAVSSGNWANDPR